MKNDYYDVAINDLLYLQVTLNTPYYNNIAVNAQQVAEKMLKSVAERVCVGVEKLMHTHNLRALYTEIHKIEPDFILDKGSLSMLKDLYFDAKYPGDNFVTVTREECDECLEIMYAVIDAVYSLRAKYNLPCQEVEERYICQSTYLDEQQKTGGL